jgi:hypothetical protein
MVTLLLGERAEPVRELERFREVREREDASQPLDPLEVDELPAGHLRLKLGELLIGHRRRVTTARDAFLLRQRLGHALLMIAAAIALGGCSEDGGPERPELASGEPLPARCVSRAVRPAATVAFVAGGRAWALEPGGRVTCLFRTRDPGPFAWGPRGDRALLARLEVKGLGHAPERPPTRVDPAASSWGRPIGKSIVFVARGGRALLKAHPAGGAFLDVTPLRGVRYERVVYHPSGLAFAFAVRRGHFESIWISSNRGKTPRKLVHGRLHTGFDAIAFGERGAVLYFAAQHLDGHVDVHSLALGGAPSAPVVWRGARGDRLSDLVTAPGLGVNVAFTVGRSCKSSRAVVVTAAHDGAELLDKSPSRAIGWLDRRHVLVAAGGCGRKLDLYSVSARTLEARLLVRGVDAAAARRAEELPPPPLPSRVLEERSAAA